MLQTVRVTCTKVKFVELYPDIDMDILSTAIAGRSGWMNVGFIHYETVHVFLFKKLEATLANFVHLLWN